ncbi:hypothetical protein HJC23_003297 [Cyclotella cryptica]|uniref:Anamorsin homolog n=1 Tax=Cyclotella cryptica TaxID=29204 RepID=A0ABD3QXT8_9STRA|eukprot:CCRYP_000847-RA/>CCRYP_000847-RA protein AED:0.00 eAED:-0.00 QI:0/-1/0/1/-1/1/1/0/261
MTSATIHIGSYSNEAEAEGNGVTPIPSPTKETLSTCLSNHTTPLDSLHIYIYALELSTHYDPLALASLVSSLAPGGTLSIHAPSKQQSPSDVDWSVIPTSFLLAGLKSESERRDTNEGRVYTARKTTKSEDAPSRINLAAKTGKVTLSLDDDDEDQLIDEDDLLHNTTGGMLAPPSLSDATPKSTDDCGGRKACDNCTCGRAEREAGDVLEEEKKEAHTHKSSCGNCAKGDAFRCAGCPYLGLPAFKEGEEHLVLKLRDDV